MMTQAQMANYLAREDRHISKKQECDDCPLRIRCTDSIRRRTMIKRYAGEEFREWLAQAGWSFRWPAPDISGAKLRGPEGILKMRRRTSEASVF